MRDGQQKSVTVCLSGDLTVRTIAAVHQNLISEIDNGKAIRIDLSEADEIDLTLIQLIESARRTAGGARISLELAAPASGELLDVLNRGGFLETTTDARIFWLCQQGKC